MSSKLVSVIMPAYNCEEFVRQAIDSILNQTYKNIELLISDDNSTDRTRSIIDSYTDNRIKLYHNNVNQGYLKASNRLFTKCKGDYITFQDADDYSDLTRIEKLSNHLESYSDIACVGSNIVKVSANNEKFFTSKFYTEDQEIRNAYLNYKITYTGSALMIRKRVIEKIGIYNEYFDRIGSEDTYWYSHILDHFKVANINEPLYYYRANPRSVTSNHTNPKVLVGHQLIIHLYKRRLTSKEDYIESGNWKAADLCATFIQLINNISLSKSKATFEYCKATVQHPIISMQFMREFISKIRTL